MSAPPDGPLTLVLTRRCDLHCGYCPQDFSERDMSEEVLDAALSRFAPRLAPGMPVKLFGGEPLLVPALVRRAVLRLASAQPGRPVELPTNGANLDADMAEFLGGHPQVQVALSRPSPSARGLPNLVVNFLLPPGEPAPAAARRLAAWIAFGARRFNILPAYYIPWTGPQLRELARSLRGVADLLARTGGLGGGAAAVNLGRRGPVPLYNGGLAVDSGGDVYAGNLFLAAAVAPFREKLRLGRIGGSGALREPRSPEALAEIAAAAFSPEALRSTMAVDRLLAEFVRRS
ncbi:MAG: radical SAM protein [Elusimicrobiota bacterium]